MNKLQLSEEILLGLQRLDHHPGGGGTGASNGATGTGCVLQLAQAAVGKPNASCSPTELRNAIHKRHAWTKTATVRCPHSGCKSHHRKKGDNIADILIHMNDEHNDDARMMAYLVQRLEQKKNSLPALPEAQQTIPAMPRRQRVKVRVR